MAQLHQSLPPKVAPTQLKRRKNAVQLFGPEGIQKTRIHSIVDHHKLSGLANAEPLEVDMRPLCRWAKVKRAGNLGWTCA